MLGTNDQKRRAIISILEKGTKREHGRNRVSEVVQLQFAPTIRTVRNKGSVSQS